MHSIYELLQNKFFPGGDQLTCNIHATTPRYQIWTSCLQCRPKSYTWHTAPKGLWRFSPQPDIQTYIPGPGHEWTPLCVCIIDIVMLQQSFAAFEDCSYPIGMQVLLHDKCTHWYWLCVVLTSLSVNGRKLNCQMILQVHVGYVTVKLNNAISALVKRIMSMPRATLVSSWH